MSTAISRKVVGKSARQSRKVLWVVLNHCFAKKFERMTREAMDVCLRVLNESNKSRFDSYSVRNSVLIISHITFRDCRGHISSHIVLYVIFLTSGTFTFKNRKLST